MQSFSFSHVADGVLVQSVRDDVASGRLATARLLAKLAEIDFRRLYLPLACSSMHVFCVRELGFSEQKAFKWIQVARAGRRFPVLFQAILDGRLRKSAVVVLAPHLTEENAEGLLAEAAGKTVSELERLVAGESKKAQRSIPESALPTEPEGSELSLRIVGSDSDEGAAGGLAGSAEADPSLTVPTSHTLQIKLDGEAQELLRYAQALLGHADPTRDPSQLFSRALKALVADLEKRKFGACTRRRAGHREASRTSRHIPVQVRHEVWVRDQGRCTFVSLEGKRCDSQKLLEYDHAEPVARGGGSTVSNLRLRCRGHNQYEAERAFGPEFMKQKREQAKSERHRAAEAPKAFDGEVVRCLRRLGLRADEAQEAAANSGVRPDERLEERVRAALQWFGGGRRKAESEPLQVARAG
jgi:5-methylcytosine-specific restriction endonuclease McrA